MGMPKKGEIWFYQITGYPAWAYLVTESAALDLELNPGRDRAKFVKPEWKMRVRSIDPKGGVRTLGVTLTNEESANWRPFDHIPSHWRSYDVPDERVFCECGERAKWGDYLCKACRG